ncbi:uncharacterized protein LOC143914978 [Arctopsyche grandis]|uniref:uncharacterized protein LOC143914978 n=1 Tax=Arctopsyche grandis TaxID=121162 RepID=UPI00406D9EFA
MRVSPRRVAVGLGVAMVGAAALGAFALWGRRLTPPHIPSFHTQERPCSHPPKFHAELHLLAHRVHEILFRLGLTHYLCYGSLWGQIRSGKALPWQADVEMCLKNEEIYKDEVFIAKMFRSNSLNIAYGSAEGIYTVTDSDLPGMKVELIVFEVDKMIDVSRRIGWKRRLLPPDCSMVPSLHCFPPSLVETPLPLKKFGEYMLPVPRDGIEIQKYLFPNNWWKEIVPSNCNF